MIEITNLGVFGWKGALKGMRNPMNSWDKSDSVFEDLNLRYLGENDLKLSLSLIKAGSSDRKFLRMVHAQLDIKAPLYWWKEFDQYKVSTVTNSQSTMHKLHSRDLFLKDFSTEHLYENNIILLEKIIEIINANRSSFLKNKENWYQMIQLLPSSFNQLRTVDINYETLISIYFQRKNHKLDEWRAFCDFIIELPHMKEFIKAIN